MTEKQIRDKMRSNLLEKAGCFDGIYGDMPNIESLKKTEWSVEFETLMRNRLVLGAVRYGTIKHGQPSKYNRIGSMLKRVGLYEKTGNQEHLVDIANICLLEFCEPNHKKAHFASVDDGDHIQLK